VDALGYPLPFVLTPGQQHDVTQGAALLADDECDFLIADKGSKDMSRKIILLSLLVIFVMIMAACGGGSQVETAPTAAPAATEEAEASEEPAEETETEEVTDSRDITGTEEMTGTEEVTGTEEAEGEATAETTEEAAEEAVGATGDGGVAQTAKITANEQEWQTYTHPEWGITFQYPPGWEVNVPDFESMEQILGHHISLRQPSADGLQYTEIAITLDGWTISPNGTLEELVNLRGELEDTTAPELASVREKVEVVDQEQPADVDDVLYTSVKSVMHEAYITWMARGPLVYFVASFSRDPEVTFIGREIAASLQFNADKEQVLLEKALFSGDETTIAATIERLGSVHETIGDEPGRQD
jgi:hypothetical protein